MPSPVSPLGIIDTHQHLWDPERFSYSWMKDVPSIRQRAMIAEYRDATRGHTIVGTVYVDTDVDETDLEAETGMIFGLADDPANRIAGIVTGAKLEKERFLDHLTPFLKHPKLKGVRRILHTQPDELSRQPRFRDNVRQLAHHGLSFDLCVLARQLPLALDLIRNCPEVSFILDHCGVPDVKTGALDPWRGFMREVAAEPNVACKVSGLVAYADPRNCTADVLRPFVDHTIDCFGWDRVMWGGDWPVCTLTCPLENWISLALGLMAARSNEQKEKLFRKNAERIYRLSLQAVDRSSES